MPKVAKPPTVLRVTYPTSTETLTPAMDKVCRELIESGDYPALFTPSKKDSGVLVEVPRTQETEPPKGKQSARIYVGRKEIKSTVVGRKTAKQVGLAGSQGAAQWNQLLIWARRDRGAMFDATTQQFQTSYLSPDYYYPPALSAEEPVMTGEGLGNEGSLQVPDQERNQNGSSPGRRSGRR